MNLKRTALSVAAGLIVLAAGLLFFNNDPDSGDFESDVAGLVSDNTNTPEDQITVNCPEDDFSTDEGTQFNCQADIAGKQTTLAVKFTDGDGNYVVSPVKTGSGSAK